MFKFIDLISKVSMDTTNKANSRVQKQFIKLLQLNN